MSLLTIRGLRVEYPGRKSDFTAVREIDLTVERGEIVGLVGESGAGKSTIGSAIMGLLDLPGRITEGEILLEGERIDNLDSHQMRKIRGNKISMIFQDPLTSLNPLYTIEKQLMETIQQHKGLSDKKARREAIDLLESVGIADAENRISLYPHQFSGGMRQRVVIALALCSDPDLIIADEPTTALDVSIQATILELIKKLTRERNVGVILITHDMGVIAETTSRVAVMYRSRIVETGTTDQILGAPNHEYTKSLISAVPRADVKLVRFPMVNYIESAEEEYKTIDLSTHWLGKGREDLGTAAIKDGEKLVELNDLGMDFITRHSIFPGRRQYFTAVKNVNFDIRQGEVFGLVGESGSGKSTVARIIAGLYKPSGGNVMFAGQDITSMSNHEARQAVHRQIQMIFQDPYSSLNPRMRVRDVVAEPIRHHKLASTPREAMQIVDDLLEQVGLGAEAGSKFPHEFSGGQRQRISIARALATRPTFLICDEPTSALDVSIQAQVLNLLKDLQESLNLTILFISHDLPVIRQMCDRVAVMRNGELCEISETRKLFEQPVHEHTRELMRLMPNMDHLSHEGLQIQT